MFDSAKRLAPAAIAFALAFAAAGTANARVVDVAALNGGFSATDELAHGADILNAGYHKKRFGHKRFGHKRFGRHHHGKRFGFRKFGHRGFGHHGFRYRHFGPHHGHGYVVKGPYFGKKGVFFKKRFRRHH